MTPTKDPAVAMARHVREWRWLEVLAYGINDDGVLMLRFDWGDEYPDERENWHPWYVMTMRQFHSWCNCLRVKDSMDRPVSAHAALLVRDFVVCCRTCCVTSSRITHGAPGIHSSSLLAGSPWGRPSVRPSAFCCLRLTTSAALSNC